MDRTIAALFETRIAAEAAEARLVAGGLAPDGIRIMPLDEPATSSPLAQGFARALADLGLGSSGAATDGRTLVVVQAADPEAATALLEACDPLAIDREATRWAPASGAAQEAASGLTGQTSAAGTGTGAASLNVAPSGLTPGRAAAPGPTSGVGPTVGTTTGADPLPLTGAAGLSLSDVTDGADRPGSSEALRDAEIAAGRAPRE